MVKYAEDGVEVVRTWEFRVFSYILVESSTQGVIVGDDGVQVVRTWNFRVFLHIRV